MADALGRRKGDPDYDASSETDQMDTGALPAAPDPTQATPATPAPAAPAVSTPAVQPGKTERPAPVAGAAYNSDTETPDQLVARYQNDYHSADASSVDSQLASWLKNPGGSATPDFSNPASQLSTVTGWLQAGGFGGDDPNYWVKRINETGGFTPSNLSYWQKRIAAGPQGGQQGGAYYDPGAAGGGAASSSPASNVNVNVPVDPQTTANNTAIEDSITKLLGRGFSPVDPNDPSIAAPTTAYRNSVNFATDRSREKMAEQAAYEGVGSGTFDSAIQSQLEQGGRDIAGYQGDLITKELQSRRQDVALALQTAQGQNAQKLQAQLAQIDNQLKQSQLTQQNSQFYASLGLDRDKLSQADKEYYDGLAEKMGEHSSTLDSELTKLLMG